MTRFEDRAADWLSFRDALERVLHAANPLPTTRVPLLGALGAALSEDVTSTVTLPPWDNSAMDGYAVRGADVAGASPDAPRELEVVGLALPGPPGTRAVERGEAIRIMTGAPVPDGADSVVRVEDTDREERRGGRVQVFDDRDAGGNIRPGGEDMRGGDPVFARGTGLGPGQLSVLSALGLREVPVHRPPEVAIVTSGDELVGPDRHHEVVAGRAIPDTNRTALAAAVQALGGRAHHVGVARDDEDSVRDHVHRGSDKDVLLTVGGASMGEGDLFKRVLDAEGFQLDFWRIRMRPGTPFSMGFLPRAGGGRVTVFGIPGNPASAWVTFELLVRPHLLRLAGHRKVHRPLVRARVDTPLRSRKGLTHFPRVSLDRFEGRWRARSTGPQGSGLVSSLGKADGLAVLDEDRDGLAVGEDVDVILLSGGPPWFDTPPLAG